MSICPSETYLVNTEDLASSLLHLVVNRQEVPETRLGLNLILGKDAHAEDGGSGVSLSGLLATNDLIFVDTLRKLTTKTESR